MKVILFQPEIPQNTGNIIRTCCVTNTQLLIVTPCSFSLNEKHLKRAGLDYINDIKIEKIDNLDNYLIGKSSFFFFSSKVKKNYSEIQYDKESILIFGNETSGLPDMFFQKYKNHFVTIPMKKMLAV